MRYIGDNHQGYGRERRYSGDHYSHHDDRYRSNMNGYYGGDPYYDGRRSNSFDRHHG